MRVCVHPSLGALLGGHGGVGGGWGGVVVVGLGQLGEVGRDRRASAGPKGDREHDRGPGGGAGGTPGGRREFGTPRAGRAGVVDASVFPRTRVFRRKPCAPCVTTA